MSNEDKPQEFHDATAHPAHEGAGLGHETQRLRKLAGAVPDLLGRTIMTGLGGIALTEETVRGLLKDLSLPKDAVAFLVSQSEKTREEIVRVVAQEMRSYLESRDISNELKTALTGLKVELKTEISFKLDDAGTLTPAIKTETQTDTKPPQRRRRTSE